MDSLQVVAGVLAHEINNPLSYVKAGLERVRLDVRSAAAICRRSSSAPLAEADVQELSKIEARMERMMETASAGIKRIAGTVELLGSYSREGYHRALRPHDIFAELSETVGLVQRTIGRNVHVTTHAEGDGTLDCIPEELNQVFTNLVQNAIEAVADGTGRVAVRGWTDPEGLVISVKDNGPGITAADQMRIFTPFFTTKAPGRGMGLGLTIAWRVVNNLGGNIKVSSQPGEGTEFIVRLPRASARSRAVS
jgi:signal transduction histidine kinase